RRVADSDRGPALALPAGRLGREAVGEPLRSRSELERRLAGLVEAAAAAAQVGDDLRPELLQIRVPAARGVDVRAVLERALPQPRAVCGRPEGIEADALRQQEGESQRAGASREDGARELGCGGVVLGE